MLEQRRRVPRYPLSTPWLITLKLRLEYIAGSSSLYKRRKGYKLKDGIQGKHLDGNLAKNDLQPEQKSILRERSILISLAVIKKEVVALCNM
jgi:hypothetical protein